MRQQVRSRVCALMRDPARRWRALALVGVALIFASSLHVLFAPFLKDTGSYGFSDWDPHSSYRYITVLSLARYHEFPWWHPWLCGGFPAWAYAEGATNLVSPYLPLYLALPIQVAERFEVVGSTLCALVFTYLLAGRVAKSAALRALVAIAFATNGRWAMQASVGHTWHLQYAWLPLALFLFDVSLESGKLRWALYTGLVLALTAYMGGVYPLPHTAIVLVAYAAILSLAQRRARPLVALGVASVSGLGFAAPKLLPLFDLMSRYPRAIASTEALTLKQLFAVFTDATGSAVHDPMAMPQWAWSEYGIYVGVWVVVAMAIGVLVPSGSAKANALKATGVLMLVLGCGAFGRYAPWTWLHMAPIFASQHVPSRFLLPAVLLLMLGFAAVCGRAVDSTLPRRGWIDLLLLVPVYLVAMNIASVGLDSTRWAFTFEVSPIEASAEFHHVTAPPYKYRPDWKLYGQQGLLAMFANTGVIRCNAVPTELVPGAIAEDSADYRGEAYLVGASGRGEARVTAWTPNTATLHYEGAEPGSLLVYNMNFDPGWRAGSVPAVAYKGAVATPIAPGAGDVKLTFYPRGLNLGLFLCALTLFAGFGVPLVWGRLRARFG
jgi:hypothetical protein